MEYQLAMLDNLQKDYLAISKYFDKFSKDQLEKVVVNIDLRSY